MIKRLHDCEAQGRLPGPSGLHDGQEQEEEGMLVMKDPDNLFLPPTPPSLSLSLSPPLSSPLYPTQSLAPSCPRAPFCKYLLNILVGVVGTGWGGGGGGACGVSAAGRYNTHESRLKQKAEHLLKRLRGKYVWQLLFTVTVVTVSTAKSKCHHFSICSKTDGPTAIH